MRNNSELVELCELYENSWLAGKDQLLDTDRLNELIYFVENMENLGTKYPDFKEQIECCDAEIFLSIPSLLVLKSLEGDSEESNAHTRLVVRFCDTLDEKLKEMKKQQLSEDEVEKIEVAILKDQKLQE